MTNEKIKIKIPEPKIIDENTSITFKSFLSWILNDPQWGTNYETLLNRELILTQLESSETELLLENISWNLLCQLIKNPSKKYDIKYSSHIIFFANCILFPKIED